MAAPAPPQRVLAPPPLVFATGLLVAWALERYVSLALIPRSREVGALLLGAGIALDLWALTTLTRRRTTVNPYGRPQALVAEGPYRYSRNPIYLGYTLSYLGIAFLFAWEWAFALLPVVIVVMEWGVIRKEERHLEARFGDDYDIYRRHVRRWL